MGWRYEVEAWVALDEDGYRWMTTWTGESLLGAWRAMREAKRNAGAVRFTWR